jgi:hypothetical protein
MTIPNEEPNKEVQSHSTPGAWRPLTRGLLFKLGALGLIAVSAVAGTGLARLLKRPDPEPAPAPGLKMPARLDHTFEAWGKPDLVFLLSAQEHGYMLPCGCSEPQLGGLERRYNFLRLLKDRGWSVVALDVGDVAQKEGIQGPVKLPNIQGMPKYVTSMSALKAMGYTAVGIGEYDASLTLLAALGNFALNEDRPRVLAANVQGADTAFPGQLFPWQEAMEVDAEKPGGLAIKAGATAVIGPTVQRKIREPGVTFAPLTRVVLQNTLADMKKAGIEFPVLLYQGLINGAKGGVPATEAVACAQAFPEIPVILCLSEEDEPPGNPHYVTQPNGAKTAVVSLGHKGKYVGVLGVWRTGKADHPFDLKYQLVELGPEYKTPPGQEKSHPILELMEMYTQNLKKENYLGRYGQTKHELQVLAAVPGLKNPGKEGEPTYVGTMVCKKCHEPAYDVWKHTPHHEAYKTLVEKATRPSNRQFDAECIVCHTVGFGRQGGFTDAQKTPHLENVGCESCHGPGSLHVKNPNNDEWRKRMNLAWWKDPAAPLDPAAEARRLGRIDDFCQKCHDHDNDVTWIHGAFARKWPKIAHPTPQP